MKKILMVISLLAVLIFSGCEKKEEVYVYNWGEYIDKDILSEFEKETGIKVVYDNFVTNEDLYIKIKQDSSSYDVIIPSDYMIEKMIREELIQPINFDNIPNMKYVDQDYLSMSYDPDNKYSVPYLWGTLGIVYNKEMVDEPVDSWNILWDEKYSNQIIMLDASRDSIGITLKKLGYSMNSKNDSELEAAKQELLRQNPLVKAYLVDETKGIMVNEEAALGVMYSGDAYDALRQNENLDYVIPKEGSNIWFDAMVIPSNAENKENGEKFIDFLCRPDIMAKNAEYIGYSVPSSEAVKLLSEEMKNSVVAYPDLKNVPELEVFMDPQEYVTVYDTIWTEIKNQ